MKSSILVISFTSLVSAASYAICIGPQGGLSEYTETCCGPHTNGILNQALAKMSPKREQNPKDEFMSMFRSNPLISRSVGLVPRIQQSLTTVAPTGRSGRVTKSELTHCLDGSGVFERWRNLPTEMTGVEAFRTSHHFALQRVEMFGCRPICRDIDIA